MVLLSVPRFPSLQSFRFAVENRVDTVCAEESNEMPDGLRKRKNHRCRVCLRGRRNESDDRLVPESERFEHSSALVALCNSVEAKTVLND